MSRTVLMLVGLALAIIGIGACGGPSAEQKQRQTYIETLDRTRASLIKELQRLDDTAQPTATPASDARALAAYERAVARVRLDLRAVKPPTVVAAQHRRLLTALRGYELALSRARVLGASTKANKVSVLRGELDDAVTATSSKIDAAVAAIRKRLTEN